MSIYDIIDGELSEVTDDYYHGMPDFSDGAEPENYVTYTTVCKTKNFASNIYQAYQYLVQLNIFTSEVNTNFRDSVISALEEAGGIYSDGKDVSDSTNYPSRKQYAADFIFDIEKGR